MNHRVRILALGLAFAVGLLAALRPAATTLPPPLPRETCSTWMAEALPGVGPKTSERVAGQIRAGQTDRLPKSAQAALKAWFTP